ncbi:pyridine nucleotide-disulfide oxidoreductase-like protein 5 [Elsinoe australis]|uniref:Pyridine nucleotide-disulfide oxidoreductase-like protein 5 n=1 Tax=Elsinoe australis TaxID=40998 RepID=A0A4U7AV31_9PEZI|nr:pyridine nucleotide-disulfide oxidoreductase-like protein 5 [Elsinoe australis]
MSTKYRTKTATFDQVPGELPKSRVPDDIDVEKLSTETVSRLPTLSEDDLTEAAVWRDLLSFTDYVRTFYSSEAISTEYAELSKVKLPDHYQPLSKYNNTVRLGDDISWVDIGFSFVTRSKLKAYNEGIASIIPDNASPYGWKIWMLRTWLENFDGYGHPDELQPKESNGATQRRDSHTENPSYDVIIVGAGQAGLSCAGRMKALGCSYLVVEKNEQVGENWTKRYESLRWHTSKEYGNLPFDRTFLPDDDYMLTTKMIGSGFQRWVERFGIDVRLGTTVHDATWKEDSRIWEIHIAGPGGERVLNANNLVLACGAYANTPVSPVWPGRGKYKGVAMHSVDYRSAKSWAGQRGVVVGTANTGHDVAEDMVEAGFESVTMVQRGRTFVFPAEWLHAAQDKSYNMNMSAAEADRLGVTYPNKIMREMTNWNVFRAVDQSPERFDALERAGFKLERKGDIYDNLYCRFGGHYVDIGTSARIAKGEIKMKGEAVKGWTEDGLRFEDGSEVKADLVVLCTGFDHDFRKAAKSIIGDVADQVDDYFGIDEEGEVRGAFKTAGHPALYYTGGDIRQCRFMTRFIALQIQAGVLGAPMRPYLQEPSY